MGFHVRLDDDSKKIVDLVSTDPSKVLGKLYAAYMLFLVAEPDQAELKWLLDNAKALDSLTGDDIAQFRRIPRGRARFPISKTEN